MPPSLAPRRLSAGPAATPVAAPCQQIPPLHRRQTASRCRLPWLNPPAVCAEVTAVSKAGRLISPHTPHKAAGLSISQSRVGARYSSTKPFSYQEGRPSRHGDEGPAHAAIVQSQACGRGRKKAEWNSARAPPRFVLRHDLVYGTSGRETGATTDRSMGGGADARSATDRLEARQLCLGLRRHHNHAQPSEAASSFLRQVRQDTSRGQGCAPAKCGRQPGVRPCGRAARWLQWHQHPRGPDATRTRHGRDR